MKAFLCEHYKHETKLLKYTAAINNFRFKINESVKLNCMHFRRLESLRKKHLEYEQEYRSDERIWHYEKPENNHVFNVLKREISKLGFEWSSGLNRAITKRHKDTSENSGLLVVKWTPDDIEWLLEWATEESKYLKIDKDYYNQRSRRNNQRGRGWFRRPNGRGRARGSRGRGRANYNSAYSHQRGGYKPRGNRGWRGSYQPFRSRGTRGYRGRGYNHGYNQSHRGRGGKAQYSQNAMNKWCGICEKNDHKFSECRAPEWKKTRICKQRRLCFKCGQRGHRANDCIQNKEEKQSQQHQQQQQYEQHGSEDQYYWSNQYGHPMMHNAMHYQPPMSNNNNQSNVTQQRQQQQTQQHIAIETIGVEHTNNIGTQQNLQTLAQMQRALNATVNNQVRGVNVMVDTEGNRVVYDGSNRYNRSSVMSEYINDSVKVTKQMKNSDVDEVVLFDANEVEDSEEG